MNREANFSSARPTRALVGTRLLTIIAGLAIWFLTQSLLGTRPLPEGGDGAALVLSRGDSLFDLTQSWHQAIVERPALADMLLVVSSAVIDLLGLFLMGWSLLGASFRPFLGLMLLLGLRQVTQALCVLPAPEGMIWHDPGFPSLLVTYAVANDFFFSGHTAIAVFAACEISRFGRPWIAPAVLIALFQATVVIVLRAHYSMDVFTGVVAALWIAGFTARLAPAVDRFLEQVRPARGRGAM